MEEAGFRALTVEALAARASVGKNTIYRRWKTPAAVLLEALAAETAARIALPDTGAIRTDIVALLTQAFDRLTTTRTGDVVRTLMAEAQFNEELQRDLRRLFIDGRRVALATLLERAQVRGEIDPAADIPLLIDLIYGAMWYRLLNGHAPLDDALAIDLAAFVIRGAALCRRRSRT